MSTALTIYDKIQDANAFLDTAGRDIAASKIFGDLTISQGKIFAWECSVRRTPPLSLAIDYHLMFNRLTMKAEAMLSKFHERGGISEEICRTPDRAEIKLTSNGHTSAYSLTWEDAQSESFPYETKGTTEDKIIEAIAAWRSGQRGAKQPPLKTKYKTPRSRMQMLWARLVSDAVRAKMPEVNSGRYAPEELDAGDDEPQAGGDGTVVDAEFTVVPEASSKPANGNGNGNGHHEKPTETVDQPPFDTETSASEEKGDTCLCTPDQISSITTSMNELGMSADQRKAVLQKRQKSDGTPCLVFADMSHAQATEMLANLRGIIDKKRKAALDAANGRTAEQSQPTARPDDGTPCSDVQVARVKQLLGEIEQTSPGFTASFQNRYWATGREKVAEMTAVECDAFIGALEQKNLESFFANSLKPKGNAPGAAASEGDAGN